MDRMQEDWDRRARIDARHFIAWDAGRDEETFRASGRRDAEEILRDVRQRLPGRGAALEIGCGIGRVLEAMAETGVFDELHGIDVSEEMIRQGRERLKQTPRIRLEATNGRDLRPIPDRSMDFVFSYIVFQHIPSVKVINGYLAEARRILRPGGIFKFQVHGRPARSWKDWYYEFRRPKDTWYGHRFSRPGILRATRRAGLEVIDSWFAPTAADAHHYLWVLARAPDG